LNIPLSLLNPSYHPAEERALLMRVAASDERAFGTLVNRYWQAVYEHAITYLKSPFLAEETTLDVFEKVWRKRDKLVEVESFKDWLYIVGRNEFLSRLRRKIADIPQPGSKKWWTEEVQLPGQSLELQELSRLIEAGIERLKPHQKEIFRLSREEGLTHEQIAQQLGLSRHTVKGHLVNTLNFLRQFLKTHSDITISLLALIVLLYRAAP
jgi:RNA polymerase sigma-70 factor (ECF subfamily)